MRKFYTGIRLINNKYKTSDKSTELTTSSISLEHNKQNNQNISNVLGYNNQQHQYGQHDYMGDPNIMDPTMMNYNMMNPNMNMNQMYPSNINYLNNPINNIPQMYSSNINHNSVDIPQITNSVDPQISNIQSMPITSLKSPKINNTNKFKENNEPTNTSYSNIKEYKPPAPAPAHNNQTGGRKYVFNLNNLTKLTKKSKIYKN
uniref:Uncharacterized protein n=1 Tax=viral metagenome TaxID=1070528 RepID=A0A6C0H7F4_9ZZZZ